MSVGFEGDRLSGGNGLHGGHSLPNARTVSGGHALHQGVAAADGGHWAVCAAPRHAVRQRARRHRGADSLHARPFATDDAAIASAFHHRIGHYRQNRSRERAVGRCQRGDAESFAGIRTQKIRLVRQQNLYWGRIGAMRQLPGCQNRFNRLQD